MCPSYLYTLSVSEFTVFRRILLNTYIDTLLLFNIVLFTFTVLLFTSMRPPFIKLVFFWIRINLFHALATMVSQTGEFKVRMRRIEICWSEHQILTSDSLVTPKPISHQDWG